MKYKIGECDEIFSHTAGVYKSVIEMANIPLGKVPCMVAKDETVVKKAMRWIARDNTLVGVGTRKHQSIRIDGFWCLIRVFPGDLSIVQGFYEV